MGVVGDDSGSAPPREEPYPMDPFPHTHSDGLLADACEELDISTRPCPQARNNVAYDGRSGCVGYGTCIPVCPSGAKYSADVHVRKAEAAGARVVDRVTVEYLDHDAEGVTAARYVTPDGTRHRQEASQFVVAGGVETPRLLLLSQSDAYPDGLANTSGLVGRYFMEHPAVRTTALIDGTTVAVVGTDDASSEEDSGPVAEEESEDEQPTGEEPIEEDESASDDSPDAESADVSPESEAPSDETGTDNASAAGS